VEDVEVAKVFDFIVYDAFIGFWNQECASMEMLGIGFDFDIYRSPRVSLKRNQCLSSKA
jgi:hypothetical protein